MSEEQKGSEETVPDRWTLLVADDEEDVHMATRLALRRVEWRGRRFNFLTAYSAEEARQLLAHEPAPIHVALIDVVMENDTAGLDLCRFIRKEYPESVRLVLRTGQPGFAPPKQILNELDIDYYLEKSEATAEKLYAVVRAGLRSSLDISLCIETLRSCVEVLSEVLAVVNPTAFGRTTRVVRVVQALTSNLRLPFPWEFEIAAMLSHLGCVAVPPAILDRVISGGLLSEDEQAGFAEHPSIGAHLLRRIPRLERVSEIISRQADELPPQWASPEPADQDRVVLGAHLIQLATEYDKLLLGGASADQAVESLRGGQHYPEPLVAALGATSLSVETLEVSLEQLREGMLFLEDVRIGNGQVVAPKGQIVTSALRARLSRHGDQLMAPLKVEVTAEDGIIAPELRLRDTGQ